MYKDLLKINRIATIGEFKYLLLDILTCNDPIHMYDLYFTCKDRSSNLDLSFPDTITFLEGISLIIVNDAQGITLNCEDYNALELSKDFELTSRIFEKLIESLENRKIIENIFNDEIVKFDIDNDTFTINFAKIPLEFPMIKILMLNLELIEIIQNVHSKVRVKKEYKNLFKERVLKKVIKNEVGLEVGLGNSHNKKQSSMNEIHHKVLLVVTTELEAQELLDTATLKGIKVTHTENDKLVHWNLGLVNKSQITMIKIGGMGSGGVSGSFLSIKDAIDQVQPSRVVMVGIAFGLDSKKQQIGDILVSNHIEDYDIRKESNGITIQRGSKIPAGISLLSRFENARLTYKNNPVKFGLILSGGALSDDEEFVGKLKASYPEAIGAEMEGGGLLGACHRENIEWILIKGICDWGYNKQNEQKDQHQKIAISNVLDFFFHTIENFGL